MRKKDEILATSFNLLQYKITDQEGFATCFHLEEYSGCAAEWIAWRTVWQGLYKFISIPVISVIYIRKFQDQAQGGSQSFYNKYPGWNAILIATICEFPSV